MDINITYKIFSTKIHQIINFSTNTIILGSRMYKKKRIDYAKLNCFEWEKKYLILYLISNLLMSIL